MKILVALDGTDLSESVLPCALGLARRWRAELVAVRVVEAVSTLTPDLPPSLVERMHQQLLLAAQAYAAELPARFEGLSATVLTPVGAAAEQLLEAARQQECELMVMASHGKTGPVRWLLGSVAERVLRQAPCPLLLLRPPAPERCEFQHILVPVDGSEVSQQVVERLTPYLAAGASVTLLQAANLPFFEHLPGFSGDASQHLEELRLRLQQIRVEGLELQVQVVEGEPAEAIMEFAQQHSCDLIAMSSHGRRGFRRFWLGSVTEKVARHSDCPLLVFSGHSS